VTSTLDTVTFLCTDIEGSTRLWEEHPDAMREALARHDAILGAAVAAHDGRIFKTTGDGAYATLGSVADAVASAVDAQRALASERWGATGPLAVRMAIHIGEVEARDGDYYGPTMNRAARMMAAAHGGQVVLTSASAALVRDSMPADLDLLDLGLHRLRGIERPERVYQLSIEGLPTGFPPLQSLDAFPGALPTAGPTLARGADDFAGRRAELEQLEQAWQRACAGSRQIVLIAGEPGIGKTRLVGELASVVYAQDAAVLAGRCDEDAVVPYQPFVESLRPYVAAYPPTALHERLHGLEQDLTRLFPELLGRILERPLPTISDPEAERYRLFEAITSLLTGIATSGPALLVLDDLHWADGPTLSLLRHVVRGASTAPLLVVACYRDVELPQRHAVADLLADFRREPFTDEISLGGLSEDEAATLLRGVAGHDVTSALTRALHGEAGGNPLFLAELLRSLMETDASLVAGTDESIAVDLGALGLPQSVRDVVARRVRRLPGTVSDVLTLASVVGPEFRVALLARAGAWSPGDVLDALDQAEAAGLVEEQPGRLGTYAFSHALIRQGLYAELAAVRRAELHGRVGLALESDGAETPPAVLADHFVQALPLGEGAKATAYTIAAARDAAAHLAFDDAAAYFERAIALLDQHQPSAVDERVELLIDLAEVLVFVDEAVGVEAALRAVDAAREHGSPQQFGRAVAVFAEPVSAVLLYPAEVAALFDEAQQVLGDDDEALRARLMALEAFKYSAYQLHGRDGRALADGAVQLAREAGDTPTLTAALFARATSLESTSNTAERTALGEELVSLGRASGARAAMAMTHGLRVLAGVHLELGDADALAGAIGDLARTGEELRWLPALVFDAQWRATQALVEGRFEDVRACWNDMRRYTRAYRAVGVLEAQQAYYLNLELGQLGTIVGPLEQMAPASSGSLYVPAMLARAQLDADRVDDARGVLEQITPTALDAGPNESAWGAVLALFSEVAASSDAQRQAELLADHLAPFSGRLLVTVIGLACLGAADRYLGMLSTVLGRWDEAEDQFARALAIEERVRGRALLPRTRYWQARFLLAHGRVGDDSRATALLDDVARDAETLGMTRLREQAARLRAG
jgi:class 3 adenylate cyclase/tetratricopeptide (TPR) repeat protein